MSTTLFARLTNYAAQKDKDVVIRNSEKPRFIKRLCDEDAELMAQAEATTLVLTRQIRLVRITWKDHLYFCVFGLIEPEELPSGLNRVDLTPGTFAISVLEANVLPNVTAAAIREAIESDYFEKGNGYEGHDLDSISHLFPTAQLYQGSTVHGYQESDHRVLGSLLTKTYLDGPIQLEIETIKRFSEFFEGGVRFIPYRNIVQGILAISWENLFLETYRCVEQLYARPKVSLLRDALTSTLPILDLAVLLETHLSWRPKEDEALSSLLMSCEDGIVLSACGSFDIDVVDKTHDKLSAAVARKIYSLRNAIVHFRPIHEAIVKTDEDWNKIACAMIEIVEHIYEKQGAEFFEPLKQ